MNSFFNCVSHYMTQLGITMIISSLCGIIVLCFTVVVLQIVFSNICIKFLAPQNQEKATFEK